jgi:hypothetical protein
MTIQPTAEVYGLRAGVWDLWPAKALFVGDLIATDCVGGWDHPRVVCFSKVLSKSEAGLVIEEPLR